MTKITINIDDALLRRIETLARTQNKKTDAVIPGLLEEGMKKKVNWDQMFSNSMRANMLLLDMYRMMFDKSKSLYGHDARDSDDAIDVINNIVDGFWNNSEEKEDN